MHLGQVKGSTWECFGKSPRPKGVFGLMDLNQVRGSSWQCLREQSGKSPRPKGVLGLMHISQVRGSTQEGLRDCSGKSPQSKGDNPSKGQNSKKIKKNEKVREKDKERERERERESSFPNGIFPFYRELCGCRCLRKCVGLMYRTCVTMHGSLVLHVPTFNWLIHFV